MTAPVLIAPYNLVVTYFNDKTFAEWKSDVAAWCGIPDGDKTRNNISKCTPMQFAPAFYKGDNESAIVKRLYNLTANMM